MKTKIAIILIFLVLFVVSCSKEEIIEKEAAKEPVKEVANSSIGLDVTLNETKVSEEIINVTLNDTVTNESEIDINGTKDVPEGTYAVVLYKTLLGMEFIPKEINISAGETIRWTNMLDYQDKKAAVKVQAHHGEFTSPILKYGEYFEHTFNNTGEYTYGAVPFKEWFKVGKVTVK